MKMFCESNLKLLYLLIVGFGAPSLIDERCWRTWHCDMKAEKETQTLPKVKLTKWFNGGKSDPDRENYIPCRRWPKKKMWQVKHLPCCRASLNATMVGLETHGLQRGGTHGCRGGIKMSMPSWHLVVANMVMVVKMIMDECTKNSGFGVSVSWFCNTEFYIIFLSVREVSHETYPTKCSFCSTIGTLPDPSPAEPALGCVFWIYHGTLWASWTQRTTRLCFGTNPQWLDTLPKQCWEGLTVATGELSAARALVQGNQNTEERDSID